MTDKSSFFSRRLIPALLVFSGMLYGSAVMGAEHPSKREFFGGPEVGQAAPTFRLKGLDGEKVDLAELVGQRPVVLEFGSITCNFFRRSHDEMEAFYDKYKDQAAFFTIYTLEAHPEEDPSPYRGSWGFVMKANRKAGFNFLQPSGLVGRKRLAERARVALESKIPILLDDMKNSVWQAYGHASNAVYLIDTGGTIKLRQARFDPKTFEPALDEFMGGQDEPAPGDGGEANQDDAEALPEAGEQ